MLMKQLCVFAFAVIELLDHGRIEKNNRIIKKINAGLIIEYLTDKYANQMPLLMKADLEGVNDAILAACGGDATFYLHKYPKVNNGLTILMNLIINAISISDNIDKNGESISVMGNCVT